MAQEMILGLIIALLLFVLTSFWLGCLYASPSDADKARLLKIRNELKEVHEILCRKN